MRKIFLSFLYLCTLLIGMTFEVCALTQEEVRSYLRQWHDDIMSEAENGRKISERLGVTWGPLKKFIGPNPPKKSVVPERFEGRWNNFQLQLTAPGLQSMGMPTVPKWGVAPRCVTSSPLSDSLLHMPLVVVSPYDGPMGLTPVSAFNPYVISGVQTFLSLRPVFLADLPPCRLYKKDEAGRLTIESIGTSFLSFQIDISGPDLQERYAWIAHGGYTNSGYACARGGSGEDRPVPSLFPGYGYDHSHITDREHMPHPKACHNFQMVAFNYCPANPEYNRHVRKPLTQDMGNIEYKEIQLDEYGSVIEGKIAIPSGFLMITRVSEQSPKVYFFPENRSGAGNSIYKRIYDANNSKYKESVIPRFEIKNAETLLAPLIFDLGCSVEGREKNFEDYFYLFINLYPFASSFDGVKMLSKARIPYCSWNVFGRTRYTSEQMQTIARSIFSEDPDIAKGVIPEIDSRIPIWWNNLEASVFRSPPPESPRLRLYNMSQSIPAFSSGFGVDDINRFRLWAAKKLLLEIAKSPLASTAIKLALTEILIKSHSREGFEVLEMLFQHIQAMGTLKESLKLFEMYVEYGLDRFDPAYYDFYHKKLQALIDQKKSAADLEERLEIRCFNERIVGRVPMLEDGISDFRAISSVNSGIVRNGAILPDSVALLNNVISSMDRIEEFSLKGTVLLASDYYRALIYSGEISPEYDVPEEERFVSEEDFVSPEEYFWIYEKPLFNILQSLEEKDKDKNSLKKIDFSELAFGGDETEDETGEKITWWYDDAHVLETLCQFKFPVLEEIHMLGMFLPTDTKALNLLERLSEFFPKLKKVYLFGTYELQTEALSRVRSVFESDFLKESAREYLRRPVSGKRAQEMGES